MNATQKHIPWNPTLNYACEAWKEMLLDGLSADEDEPTEAVERDVRIDITGMFKTRQMIPLMVDAVWKSPAGIEVMVRFTLDGIVPSRDAAWSAREEKYVWVDGCHAVYAVEVV